MFIKVKTYIHIRIVSLLQVYRWNLFTDCSNVAVALALVSIEIENVFNSTAKIRNIKY